MTNRLPWPVRRSSRGLATILGAVAALWVCGASFTGTVEAPVPVALAASVPQWSASTLWLAPSTEPANQSELARGVALLAASRAADAVPVLVRETADPDLGSYAHLYLGRAYLALGHEDQAAASARIIIENTPGGYLGEAALWLLADAQEAAGKWVEATEALHALTGLRLTNPALAYLRLGRDAERVNDTASAKVAFAKVYYEFPLSPEASAAESNLLRLGGVTGAEIIGLEAGRAEALFTARRWADARKAFENVHARAVGAAKLPAELRIAQCDVHLQRYLPAKTELQAYLAKVQGPHVEADVAYLSTLRGLKRGDEYVAAAMEFARANPGSPLAESALNDLATYYIVGNDDARAAEVFTRMFAGFPAGAFADRAAWKAGWWAYKNANYRETIRLFEAAAVSLRRADYRPSWLYWAARAHEVLGERDLALSGYRLTMADYRNSYYGREASRGAERVAGGRPAIALASARKDPALVINAGAVPANAHLIQRLLSAGLYDDAVAEVRRVQLTSGNAPILDATIAYALNRKGDLRAAITAMRRAYPQFMADGGDQLPRAILSVIFPVGHWDLLQRYAAQHQLDPYLVAALVAQESTFQADIRSGANAWGLMQIIPATGRRYALRTGVRGFSTARLTDPEVNVRIGTAYLADLLDQFRDVASALAAYNAGESRVSRWRAERPGIDRDEFVDDIPFPETQNYVKRIIGTAEDYRALYGASRVAAVRESDH